MTSSITRFLSSIIAPYFSCPNLHIIFQSFSSPNIAFNTFVNSNSDASKKLNCHKIFGNILTRETQKMPQKLLKTEIIFFFKSDITRQI